MRWRQRGGQTKLEISVAVTLVEKNNTSHFAERRLAVCGSARGQITGSLMDHNAIISGMSDRYGLAPEICWNKSR